MALLWQSSRPDVWCPSVGRGGCGESKESCCKEGIRLVVGGGRGWKEFLEKKDEMCYLAKESN